MDKHPFTVKDSEVLFNNFVKLKQDNLILANGTAYSYFVIQVKANAVVVIARTGENKFILIKEYRHPVQKTLIGCPGGFIEEDETPLEAAKRELLEETGYQAANYSLLGHAYPYPGISTQKIFFVLASDCQVAALPKREPAEVIQSFLASEEDLKEMLLCGQDVDGILCSAFYFYQLKKI